MDQELFSQDLLRKIRNKFHYIDRSIFGGKRIFLDSVSGALRLKEMTDRAGAEIMSYAQKSRIDPASRHFAAVKEKFKQDARLFFGAESGYIIPAMSGTHTVYRCVNAACSAYQDAGKNIVTSNLEHPAVYEATHQFAEKYKLERRVADFDREKGIVPSENILNLIDKDTCLLALIHGSNITGGVNDVRKIVQEARAINPGIYVVVDGVQYAPHRLIDVEELDVDAYAISGYKIFCKKASGIGYISKRFDELPHWQLRERPPGEWAIGAEDESSYAGFSAVVSYLKWLGGEFIDRAEGRTGIEEINKIYENSKLPERNKSDERKNEGRNEGRNERRKIEVAMKKISSHTKGLMSLALYGSKEFEELKNKNKEKAGDPGDRGAEEADDLRGSAIRGLRQMKNVEILGLGKSSKGSLDSNSDGSRDCLPNDLELEGRTGLIAFRIKGKDSNQLAERYFQEAGISLSTRERNIYGRHVLEVLGVDDLVRLSICHYNTPGEIISFLQATEEFQSYS